GLELIRDLIEATEGDAVVLHIQAPTQGIPYRCWLVIDLFEHKMFISPLFYCRKLQVQLLDEWCKPLVPEVFQYQLFRAYDRQFVIIDINHLFGIAQHRRSIRTEEMFALSDADDQRAPDLFEHKMFISPLFYCRKLQVQLLDEWCKPLVPEVFQYQLFRAYDRQFVIIDINHLFGIAQHRRSIRTEEMFALSDADDQRAPLAGGKDGVRI